MIPQDILRFVPTNIPPDAQGDIINEILAAIGYNKRQDMVNGVFEKMDMAHQIFMAERLK